MKTLSKLHHPLVSREFILQVLSGLFRSVHSGMSWQGPLDVCKEPPKFLAAGNGDLKILANVLLFCHLSCKSSFD